MKKILFLLFFYFSAFSSPLSSLEFFSFFNNYEKNLLHFRISYSYEYIEFSRKYEDSKIKEIENLDEYINNTNTAENGSIDQLLQINQFYNFSAFYYWNFISLGLNGDFFTKSLLPYNTEKVILIPLRDDVSYLHLSPQIFLSMWVFNLGAAYHLSFADRENLSTEQTWHLVKGNTTTLFVGLYLPIVKNIFDVDISYAYNDFQNPTINFSFILHFVYYSKMKLTYERKERKDLDDMIIDTAFYEFSFFFKKFLFVSTKVYKLLYQKQGHPSFGFSFSVNYLLDFLK